MAYSMSGSCVKASKIRLKTSASRQSRKRRNTVFQFPNWEGRSRHGLPVRTIHSTASINSRLFLPLRPGSLIFPKQCGSIFAHWASVSTKRSIRSVMMWTPPPNGGAMVPIRLPNQREERAQ